MVKVINYSLITALPIATSADRSSACYRGPPPMLATTIVANHPVSTSLLFCDILGLSLK